MKKIFTTLLSFGMITSILAQWSPTSMKGEKLRDTQVTNYYSLNLNDIRTQLTKAQPTGKSSTAVIVNLPTLEGKIEKFAIYSSPVVVKSLEEKYQLGSYVGVGVDDPEKYIRFSVSPYDFQSMIRKNGEYEFIEPANKEKTVYGVHPKTNKTSGEKGNWFCGSDEPVLTKSQIDKLLSAGNTFANNPTDFKKSSDQKYRTMRLAMSVTGEYTQYFGGVSQALSAINATLTRCNGVFENDFALHLILQDFPQLIYTDPNTDPYSVASSGAGGAWNLELQQTLTSTIGNDVYDIGHLFGASGGGGNAGCIGCVCVNPATTSTKAKGSGFTSPADAIPQGDNFDIDYVAHEMGHQLGANHTFSMSTEGTGQNVEPGSGSTIMGYAGITGATDLQPHSDPYFHINSIIQVQTNLISKTCDIETAITNQPPVVAAMTDVTIPKSTAFVLTAQATDPEGNPITYCWEQTDSATTTTTSSNLGNNTNGPTFRSWNPTTSPIRYFPKLSTVLAGNLKSTTDWEAVSTVARTTNFKVTVRDNNPNLAQQQTQYGSQKVTVGSAGPFKVNSTKVFNNAAGAFTWDVVGTNASPYNVSNVKIDYTADNGNTWVVLASSTPNDGSEELSFATLPTDSQIIVRVSAIGNIFYAVGKVTVSAMINCDGTAPAGLAVSGITQTGAKVDWDAIANATYVLRYKKSADTNWTEVNNISTNTYTLTQLEEDTDYNVEVAAVCAGTTGAYSSKNFRTTGLTYCIVSSSDSSDEYISKVLVTPANNGPVMTSTSGANTYTNYSADNTRLVQLVKGSTGNTLAVTKAWTGTTYSEAVAVWIDFNRNGTYEDSEKIMTSAASTTATVTATFAVPSTAYTGDKTVGMRIIMRYNTAPTGPCASYTYGEVEDYAVKISETLAVSDVNKASVQVYPNPATDVINISNISSKTKYEIYSVGGQLVNQGTTDGKLNVSKLTKGVYIISIESNGAKSQTKFIKKN